MDQNNHLKILQKILELPKGSRLPIELIRDLKSLDENEKVALFTKLSSEIEISVKELKKKEQNLSLGLNYQISDVLIDCSPEAIEKDVEELYLQRLEQALELVQPLSDHSLRGRIYFNKKFLELDS